MIITAEDYEKQKPVITGDIVWDDPSIKKWGFSPICVVRTLPNGSGSSFSTGSKPYGKIEFTF